MMTRMPIVVFTLTIAGMTAGAFGELITPPLCTITGKVETPPSPPSLSKGLSHLADTMMIINVPVPACTVWALTIVSSRQFYGFTDNSGFYRIDSVPVIAGFDSITIVAKKKGYIDVSQKVRVSGSGTVTADLTLQKSPVKICVRRILRMEKEVKLKLLVFSFSNPRLCFDVKVVHDPIFREPVLFAADGDSGLFVCKTLNKSRYES
jgi:hypothetical protein